MKKTSPRPVLFTPRGLVLTTKATAIYAVFNIFIVLAKIIADKSNMSALVPESSLYPLYCLLVVYALVSLINIINIVKAKFYWVLVILSICILLTCRFYYIPIANWIYGLEL
jgi:hypothetical protein